MPSPADGTESDFLPPPADGVLSRVDEYFSQALFTAGDSGECSTADDWKFTTGALVEEAMVIAGLKKTAAEFRRQLYNWKPDE